MRATGIIAAVNEQLRKAGHPERLARGRGYSYFRGGNAAYWPESSVWVADPSELSVLEWLAEYERLKAAAAAR